MRLVVGARTDVGRVRAGNEDSYMVSEPLFAVADGMGGHQGGEVASKLALDTLLAVNDGGDLVDTVREANRAVYQRASEDPRLSGMGTTLTAVLAEADRFRLAHIGDSRLYLVRDGEMRRITKDHTVVERLVDEGRLTPAEAEIHPQRSILTRALGVDENVDVDEEFLEVRPGDRLLLCSDGLTGMADEADILRILSGERDVQRAADALVDIANEAGGQDNITAVVIDVVADDDTTAPVAVPAPQPRSAPVEEDAPPRRRGRGGRLVAWLLISLLLVGAALWALKTMWIDRQYYVGEAEGQVALYRGIPARPLGIELSTVVDPIEELPAAEVTAFPEYSNLSEGITADGEEDARAIIEQMKADLAARQEQPGS